MSREIKNCFIDRHRPCDRSCMAFQEHPRGQVCGILHKLGRVVSLLGRSPQGPVPPIKHTPPPKV